MAAKDDKPKTKHCATTTGVSLTSRNMDGLKSQKAPKNRGKGSKIR
jgi:hypothetical protein